MLKRIFKKIWILFIGILLVCGAVCIWTGSDLGLRDSESVSGSLQKADDSALKVKNNAADAVIGAAEAENASEKEESSSDPAIEEEIEKLEEPAKDFSLEDVEPYSSSPYTTINDNEPYFDTDDLTTEPFEYYSDLDDLGRCGVTFANVCQEIMPTEERGEIGMVKPSGWHTVKYMGLIDGNYLYNRCHLIGYQLSGENANVENLITGTHYMNVEGMLPFENEVAAYVENTDNHVLYRVTPEFDGDDLVASGVLMEAYSVEDKGKGVEFCVYCYDVQPQIEIDYATGDSREAAEKDTTEEETIDSTGQKDTTDGELAADENSNEESNASSEMTYICNKNTKKFHYPPCSSVDDMKDKNKKEVTCSREELLNEGYSPCQRCNP